MGYLSILGNTCLLLLSSTLYTYSSSGNSKDYNKQKHFQKSKKRQKKEQHQRTERTYNISHSRQQATEIIATEDEFHQAICREIKSNDEEKILSLTKLFYQPRTASESPFFQYYRDQSQQLKYIKILLSSAFIKNSDGDNVSDELKDIIMRIINRMSDDNRRQGKDICREHPEINWDEEFLLDVDME